MNMTAFLLIVVKNSGFDSSMSKNLIWFVLVDKRGEPKYKEERLVTIF